LDLPHEPEKRSYITVSYINYTCCSHGPVGRLCALKSKAELNRPSASYHGGVGHPRGVGRGLGVTLGVAVAVGLAVGLVVGVGVGVTSGVDVGVAVGGGVAVGVAVGVTVGDGVGVGVPVGTLKAYILLSAPK